MPVLVGDPRISNPDLLQWFSASAFARPGRGNPGNSPKDVVRGPGVNNSDRTLFKNIPLGGNRRLQLRWEIDNVFNRTQFATVDTVARVDRQAIR